MLKGHLVAYVLLGRLTILRVSNLANGHTREVAANADDLRIPTFVLRADGAIAWTSTGAAATSIKPGST